MSIRLRDGHRVFVFAEFLDMRAGFEKLSFMVREKMQKNLLEGDLYLFMGKKRKLIKAICYDGTGLILFAKRLEQGRFMALDLFEDHTITREELDILLRGSVIRRNKFGENALTKKDVSVKFQFNGAG